MNTMKRVEELAAERGLSMCRLAEQSGVTPSTLKSARAKDSQLTVNTIEKLCMGLGITMSEFFADPGQKVG